MPLGGTLSIQTSNAEVHSGGAAHSAGAAPGQYVRVTVTDTGTGMGEEVAERAFDAFFTTKAKGQGSGLGLTMVHRFARQNDGAATIQSEPGRGTSVTFYLPRHQSGMPESAKRG
jgi:signal transduction histidine kinase